MKRHGIKRQTLLIALIPILVMAVLLENHFIYSRFADLDSALLERAQLMARQLASSSEYAVFSGNTTLLQQDVDATRAQQDVSAVLVLDGDGRLMTAAVAGDGPEKYQVLIDRVGRSSPLYQDGDVLVLYAPIEATQVKLDELESGSGAVSAAGKLLGAAIIEVSKQRLNSQKNKILLFSLLATLAILMLTLLVAMWAARRVSIPVLSMSKAVRRIGEGALDTRIRLQTRVLELEDLSVGINQMAQQLQQDRELLQQRIDEATRELSLKKEEAERANHDKSRFLAAASHDLRQPMHALGLFAGLLRDKVSAPDQVRIVGQMEASIEAMSNLLNGLLDISKLDAGVITPEVRAFPLYPLLSRLAQDYAPVAAKKNITLRIRPTSAVVKSDPLLLERILLNLLNNALRYTPQNGCVLLACRLRGDRLRIEVRDNGIGIPSAEQQNIFREFIQLGNAARDRDQGLGLGLAIVERLSRLLGHPVSLRSLPGKGAVFAVTLPLLKPQESGAGGWTEPEQQADSGALTRLEGARVLLVDDDALVRVSAEAMLASWGCEVSVAASLEQVRAQFSGQDFDLLMSDYRLPDGSGLDVITWLEKASGKRVPGILVSGDTSTEVLQQVMGSGCQLLHKPVRPAKLRSLMVFLLAGQVKGAAV